MPLASALIAEQLVLSVGTVRWYIKQIYGKLDAHSRAEAIARLIGTALNLFCGIPQAAKAAPPEAADTPS